MVWINLHRRSCFCSCDCVEPHLLLFHSYCYQSGTLTSCSSHGPVRRGPMPPRPVDRRLHRPLPGSSPPAPFCTLHAPEGTGAAPPAWPNRPKFACKRSGAPTPVSTVGVLHNVSITFLDSNLSAALSKATLAASRRPFQGNSRSYTPQTMLQTLPQAFPRQLSQLHAPAICF